MAFMKLKGKDTTKPDSVPNTPTNQPSEDVSGDDGDSDYGASDEAAGEMDPKFGALQTMVDDMDEEELQFVCHYADEKLQEMDKEKGLNDQGKEFDSKEYEKPIVPTQGVV